MATNNPFIARLSVRDYECDQQGIVNNAVYLNYLEHARHCFLKAHGLSFAEVTRRGVFLIVIRSEIDYLKPLRADDAFTVSVQCEKLSPIRFCFHQTIQTGQSHEVALRANVFTAAMDPSGRPIRVPADLLAGLPLV